MAAKMGQIISSGPAPLSNRETMGPRNPQGQNLCQISETARVEIGATITITHVTFTNLKITSSQHNIDARPLDVHFWVGAGDKYKHSRVICY